jgi:hypothetical protein
MLFSNIFIAYLHVGKEINVLLDTIIPIINSKTIIA